MDLVDYFASDTSPAQLRLISASVTTWAPPTGMVFDLITCVHGLHYSETNSLSSLGPHRG